MRKYHSIFFTILALMLVFSLVSCQSGNEASEVFLTYQKINFGPMIYFNTTKYSCDGDGSDCSYSNEVEEVNYYYYFMDSISSEEVLLVNKVPRHVCTLLSCTPRELALVYNPDNTDNPFQKIQCHRMTLKVLTPDKSQSMSMIIEDSNSREELWNTLLTVQPMKDNSVYDEISATVYGNLYLDHRQDVYIPFRVVSMDHSFFYIINANEPGYQYVIPCEGIVRDVIIGYVDIDS